jgi:hypothetical protein
MKAVTNFKGLNNRFPKHLFFELRFGFCSFEIFKLVAFIGKIKQQNEPIRRNILNKSRILRRCLGAVEEN